jgi:hypothetical protein
MQPKLFKNDVVSIAMFVVMMLYSLIEVLSHTVMCRSAVPPCFGTFIMNCYKFEPILAKRWIRSSMNIQLT